MIQVKQIKGIIWDLGGLFLQVYPERHSPAQSIEDSNFVKTHHLFECGLCSDSEFEVILEKALADTSSSKISGRESLDVRSRWNLILGPWNLKDLEKIQSLRDDYAMVLLSNTNSWHEEAFTASLKESGGLGLEHYFDRVVYSHRFKMRKPDPNLFRVAVEGLTDPEGKVVPPESWLFLDDSPENLLGASALGMQTCLHPRNTSPWLTLQSVLTNQYDRTP
jgi:hypothetical protein